MQIELELN